MDTTITLAVNPSATLAFERPRVSQSDQRYSAIRMWLSLAAVFEELGNTDKAEFWRAKAAVAGWREEFAL